MKYRPYVCTPQDILSPTGCFYMVALEDNDPAQIISIMHGYGVRAEVRNVLWKAVRGGLELIDCGRKGGRQIIVARCRSSA